MRKVHNMRSPWLALALFAAACGTEVAAPAPGNMPPDPGTPTKPGSFESDLPSSSSGRNAGANAGASPASADADESSSKGADDAQRAIVEADIIQVSGDRLYALSRVAGLSIIDLANPAGLKIVGRYRALPGVPFEMYLRDGVVLAMYSNWGQYTKQADGEYAWVQTSKVIALDVHNPAAISALGSFDLAGEVSDSRVVGDVMYVVGYQNGYCWGCTQNKPQTTVLSLDIKDVRAVRKVDELAFADASNSYGWNKRSITVTQKRMYVAGPEYGQNEPTGSTIQVVDISDPAGDLVEGAKVEAQGMISSRWQMDEHDGVLRVISQIPTWWRGPQRAPMVQTFTVESSQKLTALGNTALVIPPNETLNTVRFDGVRGYAITSERTDPLFTIDLSVPANPRQVGELEMPGWIYHLEPRGDRLIGLGYDQGNPAGAITVSVFDVSDMATPKLLDRVNFGGDWGYLPEDQDRIHKAFRVLPELGMILVPFSGWTNTNRESGYCWGANRSGVQLVDYVGDDLTLRGATPSRGEARRALLHNQKLITVSDEAVDAYDITNRDAPAALTNLTIARNVSRALPLDNQIVARINEDWYRSQNSSIDFVKLADVEHPDVSLGELSLSQLLGRGDDCNGYSYISHAFSKGNLLNIGYQRYGYGPSKSDYKQVRGLLTIDASDPSKPTVVSKLETDMTHVNNNWYEFYSYYSYGYSASQVNALRTDNAVVFLESRPLPELNGNYSRYEVRLRIVDLTDPSKPSESTLVLPQKDGYGGLVADGANVMLSHFEETAAGRARFYLDRIDLTNPKSPVLAGEVNVPGQLLHYDRAHGRMLTSELRRTVVKDVTAEACYTRFGYADFAYKQDQTSGSGGSGPVSQPTKGDSVSVDAGTPTAPPPPPLGTCTGYSDTLHLVKFVADGASLEDSYALLEGERLSSSSMGDARVAAVISKGYQGYYGPGIAIDCFDCGGYGYGYSVTKPVELLSLGGFDVGKLSSARLTVDNLQDPWWGFWGSPPVYANGTRALLRGQSDAVVLDLTHPSAPTIVRKVPLYAPSYSLATSGSLVVMALGMQGVQYVDLAQ
jgi:hypothetical protein